MESNKCVLGYDIFGPRRALAMELAKCVLGALPMPVVSVVIAIELAKCVLGALPTPMELIKCVLGYDFIV